MPNTCLHTQGQREHWHTLMTAWIPSPPPRPDPGDRPSQEIREVGPRPRPMSRKPSVETLTLRLYDDRGGIVFSTPVTTRLERTPRRLYWRFPPRAKRTFRFLAPRECHTHRVTVSTPALIRGVLPHHTEIVLRTPQSFMEPGDRCILKLPAVLIRFGDAHPETPGPRALRP